MILDSSALAKLFPRFGSQIVTELSSPNDSHIQGSDNYLGSPRVSPVSQEWQAYSSLIPGRDTV